VVLLTVGKILLVQNLESNGLQGFPGSVDVAHLGDTIPHLMDQLAHPIEGHTKLTSIPCAIFLCSGMDGSQASVMHHSYTANWKSAESLAAKTRADQLTFPPGFNTL
jgi:hypothetical protein